MRVWHVNSGFRARRFTSSRLLVISASAFHDMQDVIEGKDYSFPNQEEKVLKFWDDIQAFQQQLKRSEGKKPYVFYDGPPFATGLPHYGHLLAGTLKVHAPSRGAVPASPQSPWSLSGTAPPAQTIYYCIS